MENILNAVTIQQAKEMIFGLYSEALESNTTATNIMLHSSMGLGKSSIVHQVAKELGMNLVDIRGSAIESSDIQGIPYVFMEEMRFSTPEWWPVDGTPTIIFLDEIGNASISVQHAMYRLILDRSIANGKVLPDNVFIIAATNLKTDKTGARDLVPAANNRFGLHLVIDSKRAAESFLNWGMVNGIDKSIIAFLSWKKELVFVAPNDGEASFPTPRSWEQVSNHKNTKYIANNEDLLGVMSAGAVGTTAAVEYLAFLEYNQHLPNWVKLRNDPDYVYESPKTDDAMMYALSVAIAFEALVAIEEDDSNYVDKLSSLINDLNDEVKIVMFRTMKRNPQTMFQLVNYPTLREQFQSVAHYIK